MEQVHTAYHKMTKKCQMMEQEMESLSKDKQELQEKISEKSRTLHDRGPYPADQVIKDLEGSLAFVVYDSKAGKVFIALASLRKQ
ncbi:hypothetical protein AgCh_033169 [Apium graveolens]